LTLGPVGHNEGVNKTCILCAADGGEVLMRSNTWRVVLADDEPLHPCLVRVIANQHVTEMTDLDAAARLQLMELVFRAEAALRQLLKPVKINLASLGNMTPHLHWHVVPRQRDDPHFPGAIWSPPQRQTGVVSRPAGFADALRTALESAT
jgi:diadenosine tetraphosphate (Ap4A) HIT family hydrolase